MNRTFDDAVVGAGIVGLAHAWHLARQGRRVVVFERTPQAVGASIRNFGMIWPMGQPAGPLLALALRSRDLWLHILQAADLWYAPCGALHLAYHDDEAQVLEEFSADPAQAVRSCTLLTPDAVLERSPEVRATGLKAGLWSPLELNIDPRQVVAELPAWLHRTEGVVFEFGNPVVGYDHPVVYTARGRWKAQRLYVCTGADFHALYPAAHADAGLTLCKLQMMRTPAVPNFRLGPMLAAGLTLGHYASFAACPTLPAVVARLDEALPDYRRWGIHVMVSQAADGALVFGDSHEYGAVLSPFDNPEIDQLVLAYLDTFFQRPDPRIAARWHGVYLKHRTKPWLLSHPDEGVTVVAGVGGAGMTLSFGLAEQVVHEAVTIA